MTRERLEAILGMSFNLETAEKIAGACGRFTLGNALVVAMQILDIEMDGMEVDAMIREAADEYAMDMV